MNRARVGTLLMSVALCALAAPAFASFAGTDVFVPSLGRGPGASNSQWNACIWVHNPNAAPVNVTFRLLLRDQPNPSPQIYNDTIPAGDTRRYDDALATLFGVTAKTFGAVRVTTPAGQPVIVNARSYSTPAGGDPMDTAGQFYAAIPASFAIGPQQKTQLLGVYQTTPQAGSEFRYNFGFVETTGNSVTVLVTALDETGAPVGSKSYTLGAYQASQYNITDLVPSVNSTNLRLEVAVTSGPGQVAAFGSGIANRSNDPSTFEMSFRDELLAANNAGSGLTSVAHDGTLAGAGTTATPLGIANGGVGKAKLAAPGGTGGQVLSTDGTNLNWQAAGLALPYQSSGNFGGAGGAAFKIQNTGTATALWGSTTQGGIALYGESPVGFGVWGSSPGGTGVLGDSQTGYAIKGQSQSGTGVWGLSQTGLAIYGESHGSGAAVEGNSTNGYGVLGYSTNSTAVYGKAFTNGNGLYGESASGVAVRAVASGDTALWATSTGGIGVDGRSTSKAGVYGQSSTSDGVHGQSGKWGVYGKGGSAAWGVVGSQNEGVAGISGSGATGSAGYFDGKVTVTGTVTKGGGAFKIDHPLDPEHKYLYHSFVESPDMKNIYDGVVTTDANGDAVVEMPAWFEALNRDFRYQLTVIGRFAQAIVAQEIEHNRFAIKTNLAMVKVSWQVTGIRKDPFANTNRIPVEEVKPDSEQGSYLHPAAYGQPEEKSVTWARDPAMMRRMKEERTSVEQNAPPR